MLSAFRLDSRTALVTGCSRGIGRAMAVALAEAGADVIGVNKTLQQGGEGVAGEIRSLGRTFRDIPCDLGDRVAVRELIATLRGADMPEVDILVNNAGVIDRQDAISHSEDTWDDVLEINLTAQFVLSRELARGMIERGEGKIVFVASLLAFQGGIRVPSYAASKGGVAQLTKALANEWAVHGVNVNAIAPGYVRTDNTKELQDDPVRSEQILSRIPAGRWGEPDDFKGAVVFLASPASRYVHGHVLTVDGGWMGR